MIEIKTINDFENCLKLNKAMVFIFFRWSGQAHLSEKVFQTWEMTNQFNIPCFKLNPEESIFAQNWVYSETKDRGFGSIVWLKKGQIIYYEHYVGKIGISGIEEITQTIFDF